MSGHALATFQRTLEVALKQLAAVNSNRHKPMVLGVALLRFDTAAVVADTGLAESRRLEFEALEERLETSKRKRDTLLQIDASTFGMIFKGLESSEHLELAGAKLTRELKPPLTVLDQSRPIRFNAGLVVSASDDTATTLLQRAIDTMQRAAAGNETICFSAHSAAAAESDTELEAALATALVKGEFVPYFQPKVNAAYQTIVGVEALTRWHSRERGVVAPNRFMAILEASALIEPFTHRLLRTVLSHASSWNEQIQVSINVPAGMLHDGSLIVAVSDSLELFSFDPARLIVEVTESGLIEQLDASIEQLKALRRLGIGVSIDDFGTGYSSLSYLRNLPATEVKLDRAFLEGIEKLPRPRALVKGIVQLAHALDLKVVAEGVETRATAELLKGLRCDLLQGYLFGKPQPAETFSVWLEKQLGKQPGAA